MADTAKTTKTMSISLPEPLYQFVDDAHWTQRRSRSEIVAEVLAEWRAREEAKVAKPAAK
jgi:metal-responsive CopG/Arc/MetJ family transcriptional regulator